MYKLFVCYVEILWKLYIDIKNVCMVDEIVHIRHSKRLKPSRPQLLPSPPPAPPTASAVFSSSFQEHQPHHGCCVDPYLSQLSDTAAWWNI